jgi:hypothetical protein
MAFSPTLKVCQPNCSTISFIDITNVYNASTNDDGWGSANSVTGANVIAATVTVRDEDNDVVFTYDVLSQIPDPVTGDIIFTDYSYSLDDGRYSIAYSITTGGDLGDTYTHSQTILITCNFECCISKQLAKIAKGYCEDKCDTSTIDDFLLIEGLLYAYKAAEMCEKSTIKENIKKRLQRFCDYQCDDC